jgi:thiol-disulfide isomerase/thioredoxin
LRWQVVIYFSASWCGPCRFMQPAVKAMASKFTDVAFVKIDVDELKVYIYIYTTFGTSALFSFLPWPVCSLHSIRREETSVNWHLCCVCRWLGKDSDHSRRETARLGICPHHFIKAAVTV